MYRNYSLIRMLITKFINVNDFAKNGMSRVRLKLQSEREKIKIKLQPFAKAGYSTAEQGAGK